MSVPQYIIDLLSTMPVYKKGGKCAPHKAILLLTIMQMIESDEISSPNVPLTDRLINNFNRMWRANVSCSAPFNPEIQYPFFHLSTSPFWSLVKTDEHQGQQDYSSLKALRRDYSGAVIDDELFQMMTDPEAREEIRNLLRATYLEGNNED